MQVYQPQIVGDFLLEVALHHVANYFSVNKFGAATDCDIGEATDVWDGADGVTSTKIWVPPTQARIHNIVSTSTADASAGTGAQEIEVFGITSWSNGYDTHETVVMNGTTPVATANSYVVVHRMSVHDVGSGGTNAGIITATAAVDGTVTAAISIGKGQTLMCIYAIPEGFLFAIHALHASVVATQVANVTGSLLVKMHADRTNSGFVTKREWSFRRDSRLDLGSFPPLVIEGPAIVKIQVVSDTNNVAVHANIDGVLHEKKTPTEHVD